MSTPNNIHLDTSAAAQVTAALQQLLADFQIYYTNLRGFHWNIKGSEFFVLHAQFEKLYNDAAEKVDELAERILMLGGTPVSRFSDYLAVSQIKESTLLTGSGETLQSVLETISFLLGEERKAIRVAEKANDVGTADLLTGYIKEQEKLIWMLTAHSAR